MLELKLIAMHLGCVVCLVAKLILTPFVKLAAYVETKTAKKLEPVK